VERGAAVSEGLAGVSDEKTGTNKARGISCEVVWSKPLRGYSVTL
jgi:hypothetical protein